MNLLERVKECSNLEHHSTADLLAAIHQQVLDAQRRHETAKQIHHEATRRLNICEMWAARYHYAIRMRDSFVFRSFMWQTWESLADVCCKRATQFAPTQSML